MSDVEFKLEGIEKALKDLKTFQAKALPFAARQSLNNTAFAARKIWQAEIRNSFTLRNKYTERSIRVDMARGLNVDRMRSAVGSIAGYMAKQESGGTERGGGSRKAIPGPAAAGLAPGSKRTKLVRAGSRLSAIHVLRKPIAVRGGAKRRNLVALLQAKRAGSKFVLLTRKGGGKGLYRVMGTKKQLKTRLLYDVSRGSVRIKPEPTLHRTMHIITPRLQTMHLDALEAECRRHKLFGY